MSVTRRAERCEEEMTGPSFLTALPQPPLLVSAVGGGAFLLVSLLQTLGLYLPVSPPVSFASLSSILEELNGE